MKQRIKSAAGRAMRQADYEALAAFRYALRKFLHFSTAAAAAVGLESQQYQALLALRAASAAQRLTIGELADQLFIRHHSAVGLVSRLEKRGLVRRQIDSDDRRRVFVALTARGEAVLAQLAAAHKDELRNAAPAFRALIARVQPKRRRN